MNTQPPDKSKEVCQKLLRGYQFSESDLYSPATEHLYPVLDQHFKWFRNLFTVMGYALVRERGVIFLEKETKTLSNEEKQTIVVLFLLLDLWLEKGKSYSDLFQLRIPWSELNWFRDGYGKEYLQQAGIEPDNETAIEDLLRRLSRKGIVDYDADTRMVTLRKPAERLINLARQIHQRIRISEDTTQEESIPHE